MFSPFSSHAMHPEMSSPPRKPSHPPIPLTEPLLPETEAFLRCANKRRLFMDLRPTAASRWLSDWLFSHASHPFHHHTSISPDSFENALAIRASHILHTCDGPKPETNSGTLHGIVPGMDLLLVGVASSDGRLIGYSFGGLGKDTYGKEVEGGCSFDARQMAIFPHFVGRFAWDGKEGELVLVTNRMNDFLTGVMTVKRGDGRVRERTLYAVLNGHYGYKKLPERIAAMNAFSERRLAAIPKYQFAIGKRSESASGEGEKRVRTDMPVIKADLAKVERLLKGKFYSPKMYMDRMDVKSGELTRRETAQVESKFDVMDAVAVQAFKDVATRDYYSYMAGIREKGSGPSASSSGTS